MIFVDDLKSDPSLYADDTSLIKVITSLRDIISVNEDLQAMEEWAAQWRVTFNPNKTVLMSKKVQRPARGSLYLNGNLIHRVQC